MLKNGKIYFCRPSDPYGEFSNFALLPVVYVDRELAYGGSFPTSEHLYQWGKAWHKEDMDRISKASTPHEAASIGRSIERRPDWERIKDAWMYFVLDLKFAQNMGARQLLISTGEYPIVEYSAKDTYWGNGGDDTGQNKLGLMLMLIRSKIQWGQYVGEPFKEVVFGD